MTTEGSGHVGKVQCTQNTCLAERGNMEDWMELSFCHFNDYRNMVEAWTRDPNITSKRVRLSVIDINQTNYTLPLM